MDYKKIIAATAVTSAAFVVPAVVDAATSPVTDIFTEPTFTLGKVLTAPDEYTPATATAAEKITKYEWIAEYEWSSGAGSAASTLSKTKTLTIPMNSHLKSITLQITTASGVYEQKLEADTTYNISINPFAPVGSEKIDFILNKGIVNQPIEAILPLPVKIIKYDWYIVEGVENRLLGDELDHILDIPVAAEGNSLLVVATDTTGNMHYGKLDVNALELDAFQMDLKLNDKVINGENPPTETSIAPGDMLSVENLLITAHDEAVEILPSQAIVTYQWFYKKAPIETGNDPEASPETAPDSYSIIPGATGPMYLVPTDAFGRNLENISVAITVEVPDSDAGIKTQYTYVIKLNNEEATNLEQEINEKFLEPLSAYSGSDITSFTDDMEALKGKYDNLSTGSKALVPSYPKVTQALQDIIAAQALIKELEAFTAEKAKYDADPSELAHAKLLKQFETIEKKYQKLDSLKRSLMEMYFINDPNGDYFENYIDVMSQHLKNIKGFDDNSTNQDAISAELIIKINEEIAALFGEEDGSRVYTFDTIESRAAMLTEITRLELEIKKVDRKQQPVINSSLLKTAKTDIKKVDAVGEKIAAIAKATFDQKIKATLAARTAYNKLSFMQQSLITNDEFEAIFGADAYSEENILLNLTTAISELVSGDTYVFDRYSNELLEDVTSLSSAIEVLLAQYKTLSSTAKKSVTNYALLTQAKKDLAAATKVIKVIKNAYDFHMMTPPEEAEKKMKSIQSKYRTAYTAYVKLSPLQRSIVVALTEENVTLDDLATELQAVTDEAFTPLDSEVEYDTSAIDSVISSLNTLEADVTTGTGQTPAALETRIKEIEVAYKALNSKEKKGVYNYSVLSRAKSLVKKATAVETSLMSALNSGAISRMNSAVKAYDKLTTGQKEMIKTAYADVMTMLENPYKEDLIDALEMLNLEDFSFEFDLQPIEELLASVDKKEYKTIPGYSKYQEALKIKKAVEAFVKKFEKTGINATYSKKQSILKDFKKLTTLQVNYLKNSYEDDIDPENTGTLFDLLTSWDTELNKGAISLNDEIGNLITVDGTTYVYDLSPFVDDDSDPTQILVNLDMAIAKIKAQYKVLDSKERKLITHYSFISKIERDLKAVRKAIDLKATMNEQTFQQTLNRLTRQQLDLYNNVTQ